MALGLSGRRAVHVTRWDCQPKSVELREQTGFTGSFWCSLDDGVIDDITELFMFGFCLYSIVTGLVPYYWRLRETSNSRDIDVYLAAKTFRTLRVGLVVVL